MTVYNEPYYVLYILLSSQNKIPYYYIQSDVQLLR